MSARHRLTAALATLLIAIGGTGFALMRVAPLRQQLRGGH